MFCTTGGRRGIGSPHQPSNGGGEIEARAEFGEEIRTRTGPRPPRQVPGKNGLDAARAATSSCNPWARRRGFCSWSPAAAAAIFAMAPLPPRKDQPRQVVPGIIARG